VSDQAIRKQMEAVARELWGEARTRELDAQIAATAAALARVDAVELGNADDLDYLEGR
jgi:hypothetical protein